eukprot:TRINITY_DN18659_c0_g1_i1.p1 TRINITY_DN18659_c0_g1~~TRINITY_DN18659_c0_g1_i1.p1  ORF type:complete len:1176 (+),score=226.00 TRINITY_DN18659_c0_g1_i1:103-3630(+)
MNGGIVEVDARNVNVEKERNLLVGTIWPRTCKCIDCKCGDSCRCKGVGDFDIAGPQCKSAISMKLFAVDGDCEEGSAVFEDILTPLNTVSVNPGLLGVESACNEREVEDKLQSYKAFHIPANSKVAVFAPSDGELIDEVGSERRICLTRTDKTQIQLSTAPAIEQAASLALPLAKVRLLKNPPVMQHGQKPTATCLLLHIPSISCKSCASKIYKAFKKAGIPDDHCYVAVKTKEVGVLARNKEEIRMVKSLLKDIELPANPRNREVQMAQLRVTGMSCSSCAMKIKKALLPVEASVSSEAGICTVNSAHVDYVMDKINSLDNHRYTATLDSISAGGEEEFPEQFQIATSVWENRVANLFSNETKTPPTKDYHTVPIPSLEKDAIQKSTFIIKGMTCASCVYRIETDLKEESEIVDAVVALGTETATVSHTDQLSSEQIADIVIKMGYGCTVIESDTLASGEDLKNSLSRVEEKEQLWRAARGSMSVAFPLALLMLLAPHYPVLHNLMMYRIFDTHVTFEALFDLALATPVVFWYAAPFFHRAKKALKTGAATMDVLVAMGVGTAYASGWLFILFDIGSSSADTAAILTAFMLLGKYFECVAKGHTADALLSLLELQPPTAMKVNADGTRTEVEAASILKDDVVEVTAGGAFPIDGEIMSGIVSVDQSMLTGESLPVTKRPSDIVTGGTICVSGVCIVRATHVGADSTLSQILKLINDAQATKAPVQQLADRISSKFVPVVISISLFSFFIWVLLGMLGWYPASWRGDKSVLSFALNFLIATLVVACPCAMGLATPTAVMVSTGVGAKMGVFIKGGDSIESAGNVTAVLFDKTGTLTEGKISVQVHQQFSEQTAKFDLVAAAEEGSQHPVATAVSVYCREKSKNSSLSASDATQHDTVPGKGVICKIKGSTLVVGQAAWVIQKAKTVNKAAPEAIRKWQSTGLTVVLASIDGVVVHGFGLRDTIKSESASIVAHLRSKKYRVCMVTGDNFAAAKHVAKLVGISESDIFAEVLPGEKASKVVEVQSQNETVAFVGDGINDAPALTAADVGIALGSGTSVAIESADAVLLKSNLRDVSALFELSKQTMSRIRLNFIWAFGYNILALPFAAGLTFPLFHSQLPPVLGGISMVCSSLLVLFSSLLLQLFRPSDIPDITVRDTTEDDSLMGRTKNASYSTF